MIVGPSNKPSRTTDSVAGSLTRAAMRAHTTRRACTRPQPTQGWRMIEGMRGGCYCNLSPARMRCGAASSLDEGDEMTTTVQDIIAGVEVLTRIPEWFGGGGAGGMDNRGETKVTVLVGESARFPL